MEEKVSVDEEQKGPVADEFSTSCCSHDLQNEGRTWGEKSGPLR